MLNTGSIFSCLTDERRPNAPPDTLPALFRPSLVGEVLTVDEGS
jgi:hypothetical protein